MDRDKGTYTETERVEPTCATDGYVTKFCNLCEKIKTQHFRDFFFIKVDDTDTGDDGDSVLDDFSATAGGNDSNKIYYYDATVADFNGKDEVVEE